MSYTSRGARMLREARERHPERVVWSPAEGWTEPEPKDDPPPPMGPLMDAARAAWNGYVFARVGEPPGVGCRVVPEPEAFDSLSAALRAMWDGWDAQ